MEKIKITKNKIEEFKQELYEEEKSQATIEKYMRDILSLYHYLPKEKLLTKESLLTYKASLLESNYKITSINSMIVAINRFLIYLEASKLKLKLYKVQKKMFYEDNKELSREEYKRLLFAAKNDERLYMLIQTICATGIRVSEHKYITVESLKQGKAEIHNKGKVRIIFIEKKLVKLLKDYCKTKQIKKGSIFITKNGKPLDRSNIWNSMKSLCKEANVDRLKVFPHNLRHLFAFTYYKLQKDIIRLADILGHSSIDTTRIYTMTSEKECFQSISKMDLVFQLC